MNGMWRKKCPPCPQTTGDYPTQLECIVSACGTIPFDM